MITKENCIGCQACVDKCPVSAISFSYDLWGEGHAEVNDEKCINCGLCSKICPNLNFKLNSEQVIVVAAVSNLHASCGSSGGIFYELAKSFINSGGVVYGAAFGDKLKLLHKKACEIDQLKPLCKSKYIHSDMSGIYIDIENQLKNGMDVMFVGTPCQVSAVKNLYGEKYRAQLLLVDFLCHGAGTQKVFDICVKNYEKKHKAIITDFMFRSKSRKSDHSFTCILKKRNHIKKVSGYSFEFPYYNSFLTYSIFGDACYHCNYAKRQRVGDITLGDFWGIQKYRSDLNDQKGCSMLSVNNEYGKSWINNIRENCKMFDMPLSCAADNNESFNKPVDYPERKVYLRTILLSKGEEALVDELRCKNVFEKKLRLGFPKSIKRIIKAFVR